MKTNRSLLTILLLLCMATGAKAWWPSEPYCTFIKDIQLDKTWKFDTNVTDNNAGGYQNVISATQDAPGYMCFAVMSWDNHVSSSDDYDMDWCQIELYNSDQNKKTYHQIAYLDFYPENNDGNSWEDNYNHEGNYNITNEGQYYKNMNGCQTRYCKKRLYRDWADGIQFCFFVIKYSESTRQFIEEAGSHLQVYLKGRYDDGSWCNFNKYSDWHPGTPAQQPGAPTVKAVKYEDQSNSTCLKMELPTLESNQKLNAVVSGSNAASCESGEGLVSTEWNINDKDWFNNWSNVNDGGYSITFNTNTYYPQDRGGWNDHAKAIVPENVVIASKTTKVDFPQLRLAKTLELKNQWNGKITITWTADLPTSGRSYADGDWIIERCDDGQFNTSTTKTINVPYSTSKSKYEYVDEYDERNAGEKTFYYRVRRDYAVTKRAELCAKANGNIKVQTNYAIINKFDANTQGNNVTVEWVLGDGIWTEGTQGMHMELTSGTTDVTIADASAYKRYGTATIRNFPSCLPTNLELKIVEGGSTVIDRSKIEQYVKPTVTGSKISALSVSKGFYNDRVSLIWDIDSQSDNFHHFVIKRKKHGESDSEYRTLASNISMAQGIHRYNYSDQTAVPGTLYYYKVEGWTVCDDSIWVGDLLQDVGFSQPYGVVNGQVLYENGQAVEGVTVDVHSEEMTRPNSMELGESGYAALSGTQASGTLLPESGAAEMLVRLKEGADYRTLLYQKNALNLAVNGTNLAADIQVGSSTYSITASLAADSLNWQTGTFNHVAFTYQMKDGNLKMALYVNGKQAQTSETSVSAASTGIGYSNDSLYVGTDKQSGHYLNGYVSELRLWSAAPATDQIQNRYDCILNGREQGLSAYYHCDRIVDDKIFDISGDGTTFNERHMTVSNATTNTFVKPTEAQLAMRARTDSTGNYLINAVAYSNTGTLYLITAKKGIHQFSPATKSLFFDSNASTHNSINFTDISSFKVSGTITYAGGNYPAEGIMFKVDGTLQNDKKGEPIKTDAEGHFSLNVPIATHVVQAYLDGHTLTDDGFITNVDGTPIDYQKDMSGITLSDSTRVRYIGRVCGGAIQKALPVGHTVSRNNVGTNVSVYLEHNHPDKYKLAEKAWSDTLTHQTPTIYELDEINPERKAVPVKNTVDYEENGIRIHVNDSTGEFYADVFPIQYTIRLTVPGYKKFDEEGTSVSFVNMTTKTNISTEVRTYQDSLVTRVVKDSLIYGESISLTDSVKYGKKQVFCVRNVPIFRFDQVDMDGNVLPYYGVDSVALQKSGAYQYVAAYSTTASDSVRYPFGAPVYTDQYAYRMKATVCEVYPKYAADGATVLRYDSVPTTDAVITVQNTLSTEPNLTHSIDSTGVIAYSFMLGEPDMTNALGQISATVTYNGNKKTIGWEPPFGNNGQCILMGTRKKGADFVTAGPNHLITVLRDPPGSGSYSYLDAGTTISQNRSFSWKNTENGKLGIKTEFGFKNAASLGLGFAIWSEASCTNTINSGWQHDRTWNYTKSQNTTYTTTQRRSTSSSESMVGASDDVFVGLATNYTKAEAESIVLIDAATYRAGGKALYPKIYAATPDSAYLMVKTTSLSCNESFSTEFTYTQYDIIHTEIPNLKKMLPSLIVPYSVADTARLQQEANQTRELRYMLKPGVTADQLVYRDTSNYIRFIPAQNEDFFVATDTIQCILRWIDDWEYYLGMNEYEKYKAINADKALVKNYSISGGSSLTLTETYSYALTYNYSHVVGDYGYVDYGSNNKVATGAYILATAVMAETAGTVATRDSSATETNTHTKGFVLAPNANERLSIDVLHEYDWTQSKETNLPEWKDNSASDTPDKSPSEVTAKVSQLTTFPSFIFHTRGGRTCCPYEDELDAKYIEHYLIRSIEADSIKGRTELEKLHRDDLAKIKGKKVVLQPATVQIDKPTITALDTYVDGVPSGETAYIRIRMANGSDSEIDRPFWLTLKEGTNPNGASIVIDGTGIGTGLTGGSGLSYKIPYGTELIKTISFTKGSVLDYNNITLYLMAYCDAVANKEQIKDSCSFSVHFTPSCSGINIKTPGNSWVYNTELPKAINPATEKEERYMTIVLDDFDVNYDEFDRIELQYKPSSDNDEQWNKVQYFYRDSAALKAAIAGGKDAWTVGVCKGGEINYKFFMDDLDDQQYDIRAVTFCKNGNDYVGNYSDVVTGVKDTYLPRLFGVAKPANGILTVNDEIRLDFNENIAGGKLTYNNFSVKGILDESTANHSVSIHLAGDGYLQTNDKYRLSGSYTIEGFFKEASNAPADQPMTLMQLGEAPNLVSLVKNGDTFVLTIGEKVFNTTATGWVKDNWNHVAVVVFDVGTADLYSVGVYLNFTDLLTQSITGAVKVDGPLFFGKSYVGDIDQIRVWSNPMPSVSLKEYENTHFANTSVGLLSCWNIDENYGTALEDVSGGHTMTAYGANWAVPDGRAVHLEGAPIAFPLAEYSVPKDHDYTLETWFRSSELRNVELFTTDTAKAMLGNLQTTAIGFDDNGYIYVRSNGSIHTLSTFNSYDNNNWHHLTFTVGRATGFARLYVDADLLGTLTQDQIGALEGSQLFVGKNMKGEIDEVRLFELYRPQKQVEYALTEKPDSSWVGLKLYYPFEHYERRNGVSSLMFTPANACNSSESVTLNGAVETKECAPVVTTSAITTLDHTGFDFTPSDNAIIITLLEPVAKTEHAILNFTAKDVRDVNGNKLASPVSWTAYVTLNPLNISEKNVSLNVSAGQIAGYTLYLKNTSGSFQSYSIYGDASWLTWNNDHGVISPQETVELTLTTDESLGIGTHTAHVYIANGEQVVIPITVSVTVEGEVPNVVIDKTKYPYSMNVMGMIRIDGYISNDPRDLLLVSDETGYVGVASPTPYDSFDAWYVNLTVYSETNHVHDLSYSIYDASTGLTHAASCDAAVFSFQNNAIIGSPASPAVFYNSTRQHRAYNFNSGWNWMSLNVTPDRGSDINRIFSGEWTSNDQVKYYNGRTYANYSADTKSWTGSLNHIDSLHLHMLYSENERMLDVVGKPVDPTTVDIKIQNGWNGIAYLPSSYMSVTQAFSNFWDAANDDVVKGQNEFAIYYNGFWVGSLKTMTPGQGYMYRHVGQGGTFHYPATSTGSAAPKRLAPIYHSTTMSLIARAEGIEAADGDKLTVYAGKEVVGEAVMTGGLWFVSIAGDESRVPLTFVYDGCNGEQQAITAMLYEANAVVGDPGAPSLIRFSQDGQNVSDIEDGVLKYIDHDVLYIRLPSGTTYDATGRMVK